MLQNKDLFVITYHDDYLEIGDSKVERNGKASILLLLETFYSSFVI